MGIDRGVHCMSKVFDENLLCSADMQSSLHERIADALFDACCRFDVPDSERRDMADAVIAELGLFIQYENGRVVYDTKPAACKSNGNWQQRIVGQFEPYTKEKDD